MVTIAVTAEGADEPRVAVSPETVKKLVALGAHVKVVAGAGARSRFSDAALARAGRRDRGERRRRAAATPTSS